MRDRIGTLDSLRGLAATLVLVQHLFENRPGFIGERIVPLSPGVAGVAIFFLVSGYVIPLSVRADFDARQFLVRRLCRIYPLYLAALALIVALAMTGVLPPFAWILGAPPRLWLANLLLVQDVARARPMLGVSWTLLLELAWYSLFAAALVLARARAAAILSIMVPVAVVLATLTSLVLHVRIPLGRCSMIYAAALGYDVYRYRTGVIGGARLAIVVAVFVVIVGAADYVAFGLFHHARLTLAQVVVPWAFALALFLIATLTPSLREAPLLATGVLPAFGAMSYSVYLLHPVAITLARLHAPAAWATFLALAGTMMLALASYRLIEKPGIVLGRRLAATIARRAAGPQPA